MYNRRQLLKQAAAAGILSNMPSFLRAQTQPVKTKIRHREAVVQVQKAIKNY